MADSTSTIFFAARRFFSGTVLSRISGLGRDVAMAFAFGANVHVAALMVAFRFAHLLRRLFGEGALQSAFVPQFENLRGKSPTAALAFFRHLRRVISFGLGCLITLTMGLLYLWISWGNPSDETKEILILSILLLPSLLFISLFGLYSSLLQCHHHYFASGVAPVAFNLLWIGGALSLSSWPPDLAMPYLACAIVLGCLFQWLFTAFAARPILATKTTNYSENLKKIAKPLLLGIIGVAATQINTALDSIFARLASPEGPAILWYAIRLQQLPLALFGVALSSALLPPLSRAAKGGNWGDYHHFLFDGVKKCLILMVPITIGFYFFGNWGVTTLFGHGHFDASAIDSTTQALWAYSFGLIPMTLTLLIAPAFYARNEYRIPMIGSCVSVALNILLNGYFVLILNGGPTSVALATSISAWVNLTFLAVSLGGVSQEVANFRNVDLDRPRKLVETGN